MVHVISDKSHASSAMIFATVGVAMASVLFQNGSSSYGGENGDNNKSELCAIVYCNPSDDVKENIIPRVGVRVGSMPDNGRRYIVRPRVQMIGSDMYVGMEVEAASENGDDEKRPESVLFRAVGRRRNDSIHVRVESKEVFQIVTAPRAGCSIVVEKKRQVIEKNQKVVKATDVLDAGVYEFVITQP